MENIKKCPYCGKEIKASALKCRFCGHWLTEDNKEHTVPCPICGEDIPEDSKVCPYCHENVEEAVKQLKEVEHKQLREQELEKIRESIKLKQKELKQIIDKEEALEKATDESSQDKLTTNEEGKIPENTHNEEPKQTIDSVKSQEEVQEKAESFSQDTQKNSNSQPSDNIQHPVINTDTDSDNEENELTRKIKPAVLTCFWKQIKYHIADFSGKLGRKEFWYYLIYAFTTIGLVFAICGINHENISHHHNFLRLLIPSVISIFILIPTIAATFRRLHDTGRSGWFILANLIPVIGTVWLIIMLLEPSYKPTLAIKKEQRNIRWKLMDSAIIAVAFIIYGYAVAASDLGIAKRNPLLGPQAADSVVTDTAITNEETEEEIIDTTPTPVAPVKKVEEEVDTTPISTKEAEYLESTHSTSHSETEHTVENEQDSTHHH